MGSVIVGSGIAEPPLVVTNHDLAKVMDTNHDWVVSRTGVHSRRFVEPGTGASDLGAQAAAQALDRAGVGADEVDFLVTATMTPDQFAPGIAPQIQHKLGLGRVPAFDLRQQCSGFLYGLDLADAALRSGRATTALVVGAEVHAGYMPLGDSWNVLRTGEGTVKETDWERATRYRHWAVLFGDGAGAMVLRNAPEDQPDAGFGASRLFTDGSMFDFIQVSGVGFRNQPWLDAAMLEEDLHMPSMNGAGLFKNAVRLMPDATRQVLAADDLDVDDLDLVVSHQANQRITAAMASELGADEQVVPCNIAQHGNTTAGTLPILFHELAEEGRVRPGSLVAFTAFGAGAHWGAMLYRVPMS